MTARQANREHVLAVSRDFISQPRLSKSKFHKKIFIFFFFVHHAPWGHHSFFLFFLQFSYFSNKKNCILTKISPRFLKKQIKLRLQENLFLIWDIPPFFPIETIFGALLFMRFSRILLENIPKTKIIDYSYLKTDFFF